MSLAAAPMTAAMAPKQAELSRMPPMGSAAMGVETGRNQDKPGPERADDRRQDMAINRQVLPVGLAIAHGTIDGKSLAPAGARFAQTARSRVKGRLMGRKIKDVFILVEAVLGAVAVMDIEIDDEDLFNAKAEPGPAGGNGDIVEYAETHGPVMQGVMSRRPHKSETRSDALVERHLAQPGQGAGREQGNSVGPF